MHILLWHWVEVSVPLYDNNGVVFLQFDLGITFTDIIAFL